MGGSWGVGLRSRVDLASILGHGLGGGPWGGLRSTLDRSGAGFSQRQAPRAPGAVRGPHAAPRGGASSAAPAPRAHRGGRSAGPRAAEQRGCGARWRATHLGSRAAGAHEQKAARARVRAWTDSKDPEPTILATRCVSVGGSNSIGLLSLWHACRVARHTKRVERNQPSVLASYMRGRKLAKQDQTFKFTILRDHAKPAK